MILNMVLTRSAILKEIKKGQIKITPFNSKNLGPGSYDLTLSNEFRTFIKIHGVLEINEETDYKKITKLHKTNKPFTIMPGESILAIAKERIKLAPDLCAWLQGRSRFSRLGLMVHITAAFIQPGVNNYQVLEMFNASPVPLSIKTGLKVAQLIIERCEGKAKYKGKFKTQRL